MAQAGREGRLHPEVGAARRRLAGCLREWIGADVQATGRAPRDGRAEAGDRPLVLVACSGGPDSLALAAIAAHFARRGDLRVGALIVDHGLQADSAQTARRAAQQCEELGLSPVRILPARVEPGPHGPEMAARIARYRAFENAARELAAAGDAPAGILLGHTRDDQAETVLLGLARGSGTRSLAGMPAVRPLGGLQIDAEPVTSPSPALPTLLMRPLLETTREQIEQILAAEGLDPWRDPTNEDTSLRRNRVRHEVLPFLERTLGPGIAPALARTADVLGADARLLDELAEERARGVVVDPGAFHAVPQPPLRALSVHALRETHPALRRRILARVLQEAGGQAPTRERLGALSELIEGHGNAGPIQMPGRVAVWRRRALDREAEAPDAAGALILTRTVPA